MNQFKKYNHREWLIENGFNLVEPKMHKDLLDLLHETQDNMAKSVSINAITGTFDITTNNTPKVILKSNCNHNWKSYQGFTENYDYCSKCDLKK